MVTPAVTDVNIGKRTLKFDATHSGKHVQVSISIGIIDVIHRY